MTHRPPIIPLTRSLGAALRLLPEASAPASRSGHSPFLQLLRPRGFQLDASTKPFVLVDDQGDAAPEAAA